VHLEVTEAANERKKNQRLSVSAMSDLLSVKFLLLSTLLLFAFLHATHVSKYLSVNDYKDSIQGEILELLRDNSTCKYAILAEVSRHVS